jgi:hypothetical protein
VLRCHKQGTKSVVSSAREAVKIEPERVRISTVRSRCQGTVGEDRLEKA